MSYTDIANILLLSLISKPLKMVWFYAPSYKKQLELYSNRGEVVLTPFMGVGSEVYSPVSLERKAIGIELKESYYKQALKNLNEAKSRFKDKNQLAIFD